MTRWLVSAGLVALCVAQAPLLAAERSQGETEALDEAEAGDGRTIVVSATRTPITIDEAPVTISAKTDEEIADELATDIKDLVRFEPGVSVRRQPARFGAALGTTGRAGNEDFTIRGIGGNRVLSDRVAVRADMSHRRSDGFIDDNDSRTTQLTTGVLFEATDRLSLSASYDYFRDNYAASYYGAPLVARSAARDP